MGRNSLQPDSYHFDGRVAIVTGGGTGIGAQTAMLLARYGANVVICGRSAEPLQAKSAEIAEQTGRTCLPIPTDVREEDQVARLVERTVDELGRVDILINCAGGSSLAPAAQLTSRMWDRSFALNVDAAYFTSREAGRHFLAQKSGVIVNVSSSAGITGTKGGAHYSAAKAALQMYTRVLAAEWGPHGIRVNCVAPGLIASELAVIGWKRANLDIKTGSAEIPLRRPGEPIEVARAIVFLASNAASYITGETLAVGGGPRLGGIPDS